MCKKLQQRTLDALRSNWEVPAGLSSMLIQPWLLREGYCLRSWGEPLGMMERDFSGVFFQTCSPGWGHLNCRVPLGEGVPGRESGPEERQKWYLDTEHRGSCAWIQTRSLMRVQEGELKQSVTTQWNTLFPFRAQFCRKRRFRMVLQPQITGKKVGFMYLLLRCQFWRSVFKGLSPKTHPIFSSHLCPSFALALERKVKFGDSRSGPHAVVPLTGDIWQYHALGNSWVTLIAPWVWLILTPVFQHDGAVPVLCNTRSKPQSVGIFLQTFLLLCDFLSDLAQLCVGLHSVGFLQAECIRMRLAPNTFYNLFLYIYSSDRYKELKALYQDGFESLPLYKRGIEAQSDWSDLPRVVRWQGEVHCLFFYNG